MLPPPRMAAGRGQAGALPRAAPPSGRMPHCDLLGPRPHPRLGPQSSLRNVSQSALQGVLRNMDENRATAQPSRHQVWRMFDRIAPRYDLLNRILSMRQDVSWRRSMASHLKGRSSLELLDLATGTGDQIFFLLDAGADVKRAVGIDLSEGMLEIGRRKVEERGLAGRVELRAGDAMAIPAAEAAFDVATMSFGIRNVERTDAALRDIWRVLRPGGRALILEFSVPANRLVRRLYLFYFRHVLPRIGAAVSGDGEAYRYLNRTAETFPCGEAFCELMRSAGFVGVEARPLTFGIATIYRGDKPEAGG